MKRFLIIGAFVFLYVSLALAEIINIDLKPTYANDVWFDFTNGVVKEEPSNNWDIALQVNTQDAGIFINSHNNCKLWVVPNADWDMWDQPLDTTGMTAEWTEGFNSTETWAVGAFNLGQNGFMTNGDFGWGEYNMATHSISGTKIFVLKLVSNKYVKIMVESLSGGIYSLKWSNLDNSDETLLNVRKNDYKDRLFAYVQIPSANIIDREPALSTWALLFGKYIGLTPNQAGDLLPYGLNGVRTNPAYRTARISGVPTLDAKAPFLDDENYTKNIARIGSDWKKLNPVTFSFSIVDSLTFFVTKDLNGADQPNINKIVFKTFEGSSSGKLSFELNGTTSVSEQEYFSQNVNIYPSITTSNSEINFEFPSDLTGDVKITLMDLNGRTISNANFSNEFSNGIGRLQLPTLSAGSYLIRIQNNQSLVLKNIIVY